MRSRSCRSCGGWKIGGNTYDDYLQIDAPINKGNSGGPSFDLSGDVIGVNTAIYSPSAGSVGIGFDIPANTVKTVVDQLNAKDYVNLGGAVPDIPIKAGDFSALRRAITWFGFIGILPSRAPKPE